MKRKTFIIALSLLVVITIAGAILGTKIYCYHLENSNALESLTTEQNRTYFLRSGRIISINNPLVLQDMGGKHRIMSRTEAYVIDSWEAIVIVPKNKKVKGSHAPNRGQKDST